MRFLLDQDVYASTAAYLINLGHDVVQVKQIGLAEAEDDELLQVAEELGRIFVTRDRDFGGLVFVNRLGSGVLYLRMLPWTVNSVHKELERVLKAYSESALKNAFVVIEADGHRFRRLTRR
jgi:predicted nuclease of predicted toxin-antitoxin system